MSYFLYSRFCANGQKNWFYIKKSHAGCYHNEFVDKQAAASATLDGQPYFVRPQKYGTLQLRIKPAVRNLISSELEQASLTQEIARNKSILKKVFQVNMRRAVQLRSTIFARDLVRSEEGATVARNDCKAKQL